MRSRDVTSLMRLVPGVRYEDNVEAIGDSFGTDSRMSADSGVTGTR